MRRVFSLFALFFCATWMIVSCGRTSNGSTDVEPTPDTTIVDPPDKPNEQPSDTIPTTPATVDVAVYEEYPEGIDGCACYFGRTAQELSEGKYVFMTNYEKKAYMELDGEMRVFELINSTDLPDGMLMETWKSQHYDLVVKSKETGQIDETWQRVGTISIKPKNKEATVLNVVGECGC